MKCHYEVLEVPPEAGDTEIRQAYRKLALRWHPDKNLDNSDFAKEQFQLVQQAYEILSDRQERAWYDKHKEQILRGCDSEFKDQSLDVFQYFTTTCFQGYGDDEKGFYSIYRTVFEKLAQEDLDYMEDKDEYLEIPGFGNAESDFDKVSEFYAYWLNYTTKKSYVWLDPYDIKDIRDRRYLKLVEKENKKIRQKAKKERNEEVRNLAAFVKKRDKRVLAQKKIQEQKLIEDKKKREILSKQKRLERQKELSNTSDQPEWAKFDNVKSELKEIEKHLAEEFGEEYSNSEEEDDDNEIINDLYCVACSKLFKTAKAFENHESSKKHKENIEIMKETVLEEEDQIESEVSEMVEEYDDINASDVCDEFVEESIDIPSDGESIEEKVKRKKQKKRNVAIVETDLEDLCNNLNISSDNDLDFSCDKKTKKKGKKNSKSNSNTTETPNENLDTENSITDSIGTNSKKKKDRQNKLEKNASSQDIDHNCITCKSNFPSKNKLFDHLKKTGHGVYVPSNVKTKSKKNVHTVT